MSKANIAVLTLTAIAAATLAANRFITTAGTVPVVGGLALGVTRSSGVVGDPIPVDVLGTAIVEAGAAIALDAALMVTAEGKVITHDGDGDRHAVARALEVATGDGSLIEVLLVPTSGLLVTAA